MERFTTRNILIVAAVLALIAGVWVLRHWQDAQRASPAEQTGDGALDQTVDGEPGGVVPTSLEVDALDLDALRTQGKPILINFTGDG
jgi:hypothetical protein